MEADSLVAVILVLAVPIFAAALCAIKLYNAGRRNAVGVLMTVIGVVSLGSFLLSHGLKGYDQIVPFLVSVATFVPLAGLLLGTTIAWLLDRRAMKKTDTNDP